MNDLVFVPCIKVKYRLTPVFAVMARRRTELNCNHNKLSRSHLSEETASPAATGIQFKSSYVRYRSDGKGVLILPAAHKLSINKSRRCFKPDVNKPAC